MVDLEALAADGFGHWLAGFIDGEGYFHIAQRTRGGRTIYSVKFELSLRDDDAEILYRISERTGIGNVSFQEKVHSGNASVARWIVLRRDDVQDLCAILDRFPLRAKKEADYIVWHIAAQCWMGVQRGQESANEAIWLRMEQLRVELMAGRAYAFA